MNRLVLLGNGFDLAHLYQTSYTHFINNYWKNINENLQQEGNVYNNQLIIEKKWTKVDSSSSSLSYRFLKNSLKMSKLNIIFKNKFLEHISNFHDFKNWVDIENEYYKLVIETIKGKDLDNIVKLNQDFQEIIDLFKLYLQECYDNGMLKYLRYDLKQNFFDCIAGLLFSKIDSREINLKENQTLDLEDILFVNFNYTYTDKIYTENKSYKNLYKNIDVIRIHGELDDQKNNRIIFGFGDELDEDYKIIEKLDDNRYFDFIKSFKYLENENYSKLLQFINSNSFQVLILGHSCGLSDRTLLNTIFENKNCLSIKPYYHLKENYDNYADIVRNISRSFNDKIEMRAKVVNKNYCVPICSIR